MLKNERKNMKTLFVERFTLKKFIDEFKTKEHLDMFKESLELYKSIKKVYHNDQVINFLEFLIDGSHKEEAEIYLYCHAIEFFSYIYDHGHLSSIFARFHKEPDEWMKASEKYYNYFKELYNKEDSKLYWQKKEISQEYKNEDIIITDSCYLDSDEEDEDNDKQLPCDLIADTIYGDWGCTVYNKDTKEKIGKFCADASNVCIAKLKDVLKFNPNFEKWMKEHDWCVTLIKNFTGIAYIKYDIKNFMYEGKPDKELYCYIEGKGNINFIAGQTNL